MASHKLRTRKGKMHVIKDTDTKKKAGVFYTTNSDKFEISEHVAAIKEFRNRDFANYIICDPFIGAGDLLKPLLSKIPEIDFYGFDINPQCENDNIHVEKRDILANFPKLQYEFDERNKQENKGYKNVLIVSNPPYLGKAKAPKECDQYFKKYPMCNDLYKIFIMEMIDQRQDFVCIVPANFWCESDTRVRESLLKNHKIVKCSYYNYKSFNGVYIAVTCFSAVYKPETVTSVTNESLMKSLKNVYTFPMRVHYDESIFVDIEWRGSWPDYLHGEEFLSYINEDKTPLDVQVKKSNTAINQKKTNILISCITGGAYPIGAHVIPDSDIVLAPDSTSIANFCITVNKNLSIDVQKKACEKFNEVLEKFDKKYHGMFLGCYIEAPRKIMSRSIVFRLMSRVIKDILGEKIAQQSSLF